jgi:signal peptidase II
MSPLRKRVLGLALAVAVFAVDQLVKWAVAGPLKLTTEGDTIDIVSFFALTRTHNFGVSLGMFPANSVEGGIALVALTALIAVVVLVWLLRERKLADIVPLGMILGGAIGNITDRVQFGYVLDYADLHFGEFRPFLIFNVGDAMITMGVLIILARALFMREKPPAPQGDDADQPERADQPAENSSNA